jgi:hypothetical protein
MELLWKPKIRRRTPMVANQTARVVFYPEFTILDSHGSQPSRLESYFIQSLHFQTLTEARPVGCGLSWKPDPSAGLSWKPDPLAGLSWKPDPSVGFSWKPDPSAGLSWKPDPSAGLSWKTVRLPEKNRSQSLEGWTLMKAGVPDFHGTQPQTVGVA